MARITVEDCLNQVSNRFELVLLAAKRARQLIKGGQSFVEWGDDKPAVVALREIADGHVNEQHLRQEETSEEAEPEVLQPASNPLPELLATPTSQVTESTPFMVPAPNNNDSESSSS